MQSEEYGSNLEQGYCLMYNTFQSLFSCALRICFLDELKEVEPAFMDGEPVQIDMHILDTMKDPMVRQIGVTIFKVIGTANALLNLNPTLTDGLEINFRSHDKGVLKSKLIENEDGLFVVDTTEEEQAILRDELEVDYGLDEDHLIKYLGNKDRAACIEELGKYIVSGSFYMRYIMSKLYVTINSNNNSIDPDEVYVDVEELCDDTNIKLLADFNLHITELENYIFMNGL